MSESSKQMDKWIVRELQRDPRQSNVALGKAVGLTEGAVRRRLEILVSSGTLRFAALTDPHFMGRSTHALIRIRCAPHLIDEVRDAMLHMPDLERIYHCTGQFEIIAFASFESMHTMREFTTKQLGLVEGVVEMQSELILDSFEPIPPADEHPPATEYGPR